MSLVKFFFSFVYLLVVVFDFRENTNDLQKSCKTQKNQRRIRKSQLHLITCYIYITCYIFESVKMCKIYCFIHYTHTTIKKNFTIYLHYQYVNYVKYLQFLCLLCGSIYVYLVPLYLCLVALNLELYYVVSYSNWKYLYF